MASIVGTYISDGPYLPEILLKKGGSTSAVGWLFCPRTGLAAAPGPGGPQCCQHGTEDKQGVKQNWLRVASEDWN